MDLRYGKDDYPTNVRLDDCAWPSEGNPTSECIDLATDLFVIGKQVDCNYPLAEGCVAVELNLSVDNLRVLAHAFTEIYAQRRAMEVEDGQRN